jgi:hypothetical protein
MNMRFLDFGTRQTCRVTFRHRPLDLRDRAPVSHWIEGYVNPTEGLGPVDNRKLLTLSGMELTPLGDQARSQSLYRLS